ncbi:YtxH domain-containing protein [Arthrobacter sp. OVS8]|nr:YtxH domain-containing protein [Arthrobacter sp. OVS8]
MKGKLLFGAGIAAGYVLGSRSGRAAYEKLKTRAAALWESQPVQDKVAAATEAVKEKAPEVSEQLGEAARRAGTVIGSAVRRDTPPTGTTGDGSAAQGGIPAHSTHPETVNLGTSVAAGASDVDSDPALSDQHGQDWSDEGGATRAGAATNVDPDKAS